MAELASKVYGDALFELAYESQRVPEYQKQVELLRQAFLDNPAFFRLMGDPRLTRGERVRILQGCLSDRISKDLEGFLLLTVEKGRFQEIDAMFACFLDRVRAYQGIGRATVVSAAPLDDTWKRRIEEKLLSTTNYRTMEMSYQVDEALLGGLVIRIGDRVADASVRHRLEKMTARLMDISPELEKEGGWAP